MRVFRLFLLFVLLTFLNVMASVNMNAIKFQNKSYNTLTEKVNHYKYKYRVKCLNEKITDNQGNGFDSLYGTRNMRTILYGIAYRGGANNFYHRENKRDNKNPLPEDGLRNLCEQGFSSAVYLYGTNFATAQKKFTSIDSSNEIKYLQNSSTNREDLKKIMKMVKDVIDNPSLGPIYLHCWNGWHQSGYVSAAILMQFCKFSNDEAYQYWIDNTDGVNKGYEKVKKQVQTFVPFIDINIDSSISKEICPCMK